MGKLNRNLQPANAARTRKADELAIRVYEVIKPMIDEGKSLDEMANEIIMEGIKSARGNFRWDRNQVARVISRVKDRNLCP